jgi:uncharacterized protein with FMN-binding domain
MKKYLLSLGVVLLFVFYVVLNKQNSASVASMAGTAPSATATASTASGESNVAVSAGPLPNYGTDPTVSRPSAPKPTPTPVTTPAPTPTPAPAPSTGMYKDGSYTGPVTDAYYGNIQVQAIVQGGKLADVQFLQYPSDRGTSVRINTQAMPLLKQEAIQAQSANVDVVSGATATSEAFQQSLVAALAQAKS